MGFPFKLFIRPALKLVGGFLRALDKDDTGIEDEIGRLIEELGDSPNLGALVKKVDDKKTLDAKAGEVRV